MVPLFEIWLDLDMEDDGQWVLRYNVVEYPHRDGQSPKKFVV